MDRGFYTIPDVPAHEQDYARDVQPDPRICDIRRSHVVRRVCTPECENVLIDWTYTPPRKLQPYIVGCGIMFYTTILLSWS